jgi:hypothetical protein
MLCDGASVSDKGEVFAGAGVSGGSVGQDVAILEAALQNDRCFARWMRGDRKSIVRWRVGEDRLLLQGDKDRYYQEMNRGHG